MRDRILLWVLVAIIVGQAWMYRQQSKVVAYQRAVIVVLARDLGLIQ
jgi:hypothetical protein